MRVHCFFFFVLLSAGFASQAQNPILQVGRLKNTYVIINGTIPGKPDVGGDSTILTIAQLPQQNDTTTIYKLVARQAGFASTNMLIPCRDTIFEFTIVYSADPQQTRYPFRYSGQAGNDGRETIDKQPGGEMVQNGPISVPVESLQKMQESKRNVNLSASSERMIFLLDNIGADDEHHYFKFRIRNNSPNPYRIDYLKFIVEPNGKNGIGSRKRTTAQTIYPSYIEAPGNPSVIAPGKEQELIYALQLLPLTKKEQLTVVIHEKVEISRGRSLTLNVQAGAFKKTVKL